MTLIVVLVGSLKWGGKRAAGAGEIFLQRTDMI